LGERRTSNLPPPETGERRDLSGRHDRRAASSKPVETRQSGDRRAAQSLLSDEPCPSALQESLASMQAALAKAAERRRGEDRRTNARRQFDLGPPPGCRERRFRGDRRGMKFIWLDKDY